MRASAGTSSDRLAQLGAVSAALVKSHRYQEGHEVKLRDMAEDAAISVIGGYLATTLMGKFNMKLYQMQTDEAREQEDNTRPGPPPQIAAKKIFGLVGINLEGKALEGGTMLMHYGLAASWAPVYMLLRRRAGMTPVGAGLASGAAMSLIVDEGLTPLLGFSAPNKAYPLVTHVRAFVAHQVFALGLAAVIETGWALGGRRPDER
jgi:uncharacterized membrane protein YagU involved in acid resistance